MHSLGLDQALRGCCLSLPESDQGEGAGIGSVQD